MLSNLGTSTTHKKKQGRIITPLPMTAFYNKQYFISQFTSLHHDSTQPALIHQLLASGLQNTHSEFWILYDDDTHQPIACVGANTVMSDPSMGYVGLFEAKTEEAGVAVLNAAIEWLRHGGLQQFKPVRQILGPVNMTTWLQYRLRIDTEPQPSMSFEPRHPHFYDTCFSKAGFVKAMDYYSTFFHIDDLLEGYQAYTHGVSLESVGLILQPWNTLDFQASLNPEKHPELSSTPQDDVAKRLYDLSIGMFRGKEFFDEGFTRSNHRQVVLNDMVSRQEVDNASLIDLSAFVVDKRTGEDTGYVACWVENHDTLVIKTLGVLQKYRKTKAFAVMIREVARRAKDYWGCTKVVCALVNENTACISEKAAGGRGIRHIYRLYMHQSTPVAAVLANPVKQGRQEGQAIEPALSRQHQPLLYNRNSEQGPKARL